MKTVIIIFAIIIIILTFDFFTISFFKNETEYYNNEISNIIENTNKGYYLKAEGQMEDLNKHWLKKRKIWNMLCDHSEVEEISILLCTSTSALEHQKYFTCVTALKNLDFTIEFAGDRYAMLVDNIS